jgi:hypothetical protein
VLVAHEVGDGEVFQAQAVVGLDELAGDLVEEASTGIGDAGVLLGKPTGDLGVVAGAALGAGQGPTAAP